MIFHKSRSLFYDFLQISERLPGLILNRGAKSQMLRASEIFWSVCGISGTKKIPQKISNMQTLPFPKPAHFQWTQDQGVTPLRREGADRTVIHTRATTRHLSCEP